MAGWHHQCNKHELGQTLEDGEGQGSLACCHPCSYIELDMTELLNGTELRHFIISFPGGSDGKESACNAGDLSLIPGLGRSPGERNATHSSILAWIIPWTEEPDRLQFMGSQI